jgi:transcriptional regulator with XRE-family HTH domain
VSDRTAPTPYGEILAVLDALPLIIREARRRKGLSLRRAADEAGVAASTMMRVEEGVLDCRLDSAKSLLRWAAA